MKKRIVVLSTLIVLLLSITFINYNTKDKEYINKEIKDIKNTNVIAAYVIQEDGTYKQVSDIPQSGYQINTEKSTCSNGARPTGVVPNITINNLSKNGTSCYLYFDKYEPKASETILSGITVKSGTPDFSQVATTDEGVYAVSDGMYEGTSYYWRGAVTNNYVKFANFCWRIVRINGDGSIRLIYDGTSCHANGTSTTDSLIQPTSGTTGYPYNTSYNQSNYVGWTYEGQLQRPSNNSTATASNAKTQTESWFDANITGTNLSKVDTSAKFCNDRNTASGSTWAIDGSTTFYYAAYGRLDTNKTPSLGCDISDRYTLKVGLITADEVAYAGGVAGQNNISHYLYNGQNYWTMSPRYWNSPYAQMLIVNTDGSLYGIGWVNKIYGLRPVINLKSDTTFSDGNGTLDNPYVVS